LKSSPVLSTLFAHEHYRLTQTTTPVKFALLNEAQRMTLERLGSEEARHHALLGVQLKNSVSGISYPSRQVSLSHSENVAVMAVHQDSSQCVGVDIEAVHRGIHPRLRARLTPSFEEAQRVEKLPSLGLWCVKEALWKAWKHNHQGLIKAVNIRHVVEQSPQTEAPKRLLFEGQAQAPCGQPLQWHLYEIDSLGPKAQAFYVAVAFSLP
jgi:phosphopantetheinyl transferase (holo-ACP synthase)